MIKILTLKKDELGCISGGWTCAQVYKEENFRQARWVLSNIHRSKSRGLCQYGSSDGEIFYRAPDNVIGIEQKPMNFWPYAGSIAGDHIYDCYNSNASKCVFREE